MTARPVILDVDTGIDDALAIAYALRSPELDVVGLTTVFGNNHVSLTTRNTLAILELWGRPDVPVYAGASRPLVHPHAKEPSTVHGKNGLGELELPEPAGAAQSLHAVDYLIETARTRPGQVTLVPTGPLTNLALAESREPGVLRQFERIVIMGGAVTVPGNVTPAAEANIFADPEAARAVFQSGARITLVGLDVTMKTLLRPEALERVCASSDKACCTLGTALRFYLKAYQGFYPKLGGCAMHDPLAVAVAADPTLATTRALHVDVECRGDLTRGMTVGDLRGSAPHRTKEPNIDVCISMDSERFLTLLLERLGA